MTLKQLKSMRWVLACEGGYAALDRKGKCIVVLSIEDALVFDGRDNEVMKINYYSSVLGRQFIMEKIA